MSGDVIELEVDEPFGARREHHRMFDRVRQVRILALGSRDAGKVPQDAAAYAANLVTGVQAHVIADGASVTTAGDLVVRAFARDLAWQLTRDLLAVGERGWFGYDELPASVLETCARMAGSDTPDYAGAAAVVGGFVLLPEMQRLWMFALGNIGVFTCRRTFMSTAHSSSIFGGPNLVRHGEVLELGQLRTAFEELAPPEQVRVLVASDGTRLAAAAQTHAQPLKRAMFDQPDAIIELLVPDRPVDDATLLYAAVDT